eukprot:215419-Chlamydomonas_euryale.AAC.5
MTSSAARPGGACVLCFSGLRLQWLTSCLLLRAQALAAQPRTAQASAADPLPASQGSGFSG